MTTTETTVTRKQRPDGAWVWQVTQYDAVKTLLTDHRLGMSLPDPESPGWDADPKVHQILMRMATGGRRGIAADQEDRVMRRRIMNKLFAGPNVVRVKPLIGPMAEQLADELRSRPQPADLGRNFSAPLCALTMNELIGVPREDMHRFREWMDEASASGDGQPGSGLRHFVVYINKLFAERKRNPVDGDIMTDILEPHERGDERHERRLLNILVWMLGMGWQNPSATVDFAVSLLLTNPGQLDLLKDDLSLLPGAVEEAIRLYNSQPPNDGMVVRYAVEDFEFDGAAISIGDKVMLDIWAANRDGSVFADPLKFDITRDPNPHIGFGHGVYACNFGQVTRAEVEASIAALVDALPGLRPAVPADELQYTTPDRPSGLVRFPVLW
ncbi:MAG: cytochrome P450 [Streptosporangiaceae bacterium]|nr:cytochrome P450 [Streptosporangiaceae bacterium]